MAAMHKRLFNPSPQRIFVILAPLRALLSEFRKTMENLAFTVDDLKSVMEKHLMPGYTYPDFILVQYEHLHPSMYSGFQSTPGYFIKELQQKGLLRAIIMDEAHCLVEHSSFREVQYAIDLSAVPVSITYLSATLSPENEVHLFKKMDEKVRPVVFRTSTVRPGIEYDWTSIPTRLKTRDEKFDFLYDQSCCLYRKVGGKIILYTSTVAESEELYMYWNGSLDSSVKIFKYNGQMSEMEKDWNDKEFTRQSDATLAILIGTTAFCMGINKKDVMGVIIYK